MGTITFQQVPVNELFRSLDGYVCRKLNEGQAEFVNFLPSDNRKTSIYKAGARLPFASYEPVSMDITVTP